MEIKIEKKRGPKLKYGEEMKEITFRLPISLITKMQKVIVSRGINSFVIETLKMRLNSLALSEEEAIEKLRKIEEEREKAQDELKEIQKMKAEEELHAEENRIENLAKASILRSWLSNGEGWKKIPWLSNIKRDTDTDNFYIPSSTVMQINSDRNSGKLTPRSPIEEFVKYDWILKKNASTQEFLFRHKTEIMKVLGKASLESPFKGGE